MDSLLFLAAEILIVGISVWVVTLEAKTPAQISQALDTPPKQRKARYADLASPFVAKVVRRR